MYDKADFVALAMGISAQRGIPLAVAVGGAWARRAPYGARVLLVYATL